MGMREDLERIREEALEAIDSAASEQELEPVRIRYSGKKGALTAILKMMGKLSAEERPVMGQFANEVRAQIETKLGERFETLRALALEAKLKAESLDVTMPGKAPVPGYRHPLTTTIADVRRVFESMGFQTVEGPEVELAYYNFDALNTSADHPARDPQDTFYITDDVVLRTQTSSVQIRTMQGKEPPIRVIAPGRVYRNDDLDATHSPLFHQIEGLLIDRGVRMSDLKGYLEVFAQSIFGAETRVRFRPHHFPFTEPSAEMDVSCFACGGAGCRLCKGEGWIEILGCGMVHPNVLRACDIDPEVYSGFAFGMGVERIAMLRYKIDEIRKFYDNDLRFLSQFNG